MYYTAKQIAHFWLNVDKSNENNACWEWIGYKDKHGYGVVKFSSKSLRAHRVAWVIANGEIPNGLLICHHCDNRKCCNPDHLFLGTHKDNVQDRDAKGRANQVRGEKHYRAKLTEKQVLEIRHRFKSESVTYTQLSREYQVSRVQISNIIRNKQRLPSTKG